MSLDEAIERTAKAYAREAREPAAVEVVARHLGYKDANNGAALQAIASLRYYGLLDRPSDGMLAVSRTFETYRTTSDQGVRRKLVDTWLKTPPLFAELLTKFTEGLPSDDILRDELRQKQFSPAAADTLIAVLRRSVDFVGHFVRNEGEHMRLGADTPSHIAPDQGSSSPSVTIEAAPHGEADRIPIRLPGGRRAWLIVPSPFYSGDKARIKAQVDLLLTDDEDSA